jgi:hypothetical protein
MRNLIKVGGVAVLSGLLLSCALVWLLVVNAPSQEEPDSSQMKLVQERIRVTVKKRAQYELLKGMVGECAPFDSTHGEPWEFVVNQWQRKQLERTGAKVRVIAEIKPEEEEHQVEYRLVREIDLKADGVESVILGPKKDKNSALSEIILGLEDEGKGVTKVTVYDFNFDPIGEMRLRDVTFSRNLEYIGGIEYTSATQDASEKWMYKFQLLDYTGKKLWELRERELHEVNCTYSISNRGTVIELDHGSGVVTFIDQDGNDINKIQLYVGTGDPGGQGIRGEFSEDGRYLLIQAGDDHGHAFGEGIGLLLFTWDGKELWRFNTEDKGMGAKGISWLDNYVAVSTKATTYLLSREGNPIKEFDQLFATGICFSSNEEYMLLTEHGHTTYVIRLENGEIISKYTFSGWPGRIYHADIAGDAEVYGFISCIPGQKVEVMLVRFDGREVWSKTFPYLEHPGGKLRLSLSDDGKEIIIAIGSKTMIYQQEE